MNKGMLMKQRSTKRLGMWGLALLATHYLLPAPLVAGLTDFKTIEAATKAYEEGRYTKSAALLEDLDKNVPQKMYDLGNAYYKSGNYKAALEAYEKAQGEGVDEAQRLHNIGNAYFKQNALDKAIEAYEKALKLRDDADTRHNLELAKRKKRKQEQKKKEQQKQQQKQQNQQNKQNQQNQQNRKNQQNKQNRQNQQNKQNQQNQQNQQNKQNQNKQNQNNQGQQNKQQQNKQQGQQKPQNKQGKAKPKQQKGEQERKGQDKGQQPQQAKQDQKQKAKKQQAAAAGGGKQGDKKALQAHKMSRAEKIKRAEMNRLLKKTGGKKVPTLMYEFGNAKPKQDKTLKPW